MKITPNNAEYRKYFHIDRNSFVVILAYLEIEDFFVGRVESHRSPGRPHSVQHDSVLMGIISYFATDLSLLQFSFNSGIF